MTHRSLLIGSQTFGLSGCHNDVAVMKASLRKWSFETEVLLGKQASRAGILAGLRSLIGKTQRHDSVVIYYSGHGGLIANSISETQIESRHHQFLAPTDISQSTDNDFRGILDLELAWFLGCLTGKTKNVTLILDCCHAALMVRNMKARALPETWNTCIYKHMEGLKKQGLGNRPPGANPLVTRLVAAGRHQCAYEYPSPENGPIGLFTENLIRSLDLARNEPVSWAVLMAGIRERVLTQQPFQRVEVEGPSHRLPFSNQTQKENGALTFFNDGNLFSPIPSLRGGTLNGVNVGDVFELIPEGASPSGPTQRCGLAEVTAVCGSVSRVKTQPPGQRTGLTAIPIKQAIKTKPVAFQGIAPQDLLSAIYHNPYLQICNKGEKPMAWVRIHRGQMVILDETMGEFCYPTLNSQKILENLIQMAKALSLRQLDHGEENTLEHGVQLTWGKVIEGMQQQLPCQGAHIHCGTRIFVQLINKGSRPVFAHLLNIGVSRRVSMLNSAHPSGIELRPGHGHCVGKSYGLLRGMRISWPDSVPTNASMPETILIIFSENPEDLSMLETNGVSRSYKNSSNIQQLIAQVQTGRKRVIYRNQTERGGRYCLERLQFLVSPRRPNPVK